MKKTKEELKQNGMDVDIFNSHCPTHWITREEAKEKYEKINLSDYSDKYEVFDVIDTGLNYKVEVNPNLMQDACNKVYEKRKDLLSVSDLFDNVGINKLAQGRVDKANKDFSAKEGYDLKKIGSNLWWVKS